MGEKDDAANGPPDKAPPPRLPAVPAANIPAHLLGEEEQYDPASPRCGLCRKPMRRAEPPEATDASSAGTPIEGMKYFHADCLARLGPGGRGLA